MLMIVIDLLKGLVLPSSLCSPKTLTPTVAKSPAHGQAKMGHSPSWPCIPRRQGSRATSAGGRGRATGRAFPRDYLLADKIIEACNRRTGHPPGYGFLSENEGFAQRCEDEGIAFIGPKGAFDCGHGRQDRVKKLANEAKVNTIPGYNDAIAGPEAGGGDCQGHWLPVMIKASAGGGGRPARGLQRQGSV